MTHQRAAFAAEPLQFPQGQGDPADHQFPAPVEGFPEGETTGAFRKFRFDREAEAAGETSGEAGGQLDTDAGISQLMGSGAHQHEGLSWCELHRLWRCAFQAPFNGREDGKGTAEPFQQHFTGLFDGDFTELQLARTGGPGRRGR